MDSNPSLCCYRSRVANGSDVKKPSPEAGLTNAHGVSARGDHRVLRRRLAIGGSGFGAMTSRTRINGVEVDVESVLLREANQLSGDVRGRFADALLELRDGRLGQIQRGTESGLRKPEAFADAGDCVHGTDISRTGNECQQSGCLLIMRPTYIVRACQQNP